MNPNWHNKFECTFQLAHEIAYILRDDETDVCFYDTSFKNKSGIEYQANLTVVKLLTPFYCKETEKEDVNGYSFINFYCIPKYLDEAIKDIILVNV